MVRNDKNTFWDHLFIWSARYVGWFTVLGFLCHIILGRDLSRKDVGEFFPVLFALAMIYLFCFFYFVIYTFRVSDKSSQDEKDN